MSFICKEAAFKLTRKMQTLYTKETYDNNINLVYNIIISSIIKEIKYFIKDAPFNDIILDIKTDLYTGRMVIDIIQIKNNITIISEIKFKILNTENEKNTYNIFKKIYLWVSLGRYKTGEKMYFILNTLLAEKKIKHFFNLTKSNGCNKLSATYKITLKK